LEKEAKIFYFFHIPGYNIAQNGKGMTPTFIASATGCNNLTKNNTALIKTFKSILFVSNYA